MTTLADDIKKALVIYALPSKIIAETFALILSLFVSVLAFVSSLAIDDAHDSLNNATLFQQPGFEEFYSYVVDNYTEFQDDYTISVSNAALWVCRKGSPDGDFYRSCYRWAIALLIIFHIFTAFGRFFTPQFWQQYNVKSISDIMPDMLDAIIDQVTFWEDNDDIDHKVRRALRVTIGAVLFNFAFLMLLLSYDITPWSCIDKPSIISFNYIPQTNRFDVQIDHSPSAIRFQTGAAITALILGVIWGVAHIYFFIFDCCKGYIDIKVDPKVDEADVPLELSDEVEAAEDNNDDNDEP